MSKSVADRVVHRMPRPVVCDECKSGKIELQSKRLMGLRLRGPWDLIWHCGDCGAYVGCHEGTDIPLGTMASRDTRHARYVAHKVLDPLWKGRRAIATRPEVYAWISRYLALPPEKAHISMLNECQCNMLIEAVDSFKAEHATTKPKVFHWKERTKKKRRK